MKTRRNDKNGIALGTVLLGMTTMLTLVFLVLSTSLSHLSLVSRVSQTEHANNLAEAALADAIEALISQNGEFGKKPSDRMLVTTAGLDDAEGIVSFNRSEFPGKHSTNNLESEGSIPGAQGRVIPGRSVHLIARGRVGEIERWVECIYHKPPFPDGLVSSGSVLASGLILNGVSQEEGYAGGDPSQIIPENKVPANLFSNAVDGGPGEPAVVLGPDCHVSGSVGAAGGVVIDPKAIVEGEVLPGHEPRPVPKVDIADRMATLAPNSVDLASSYGGNLTLDKNWFNNAPGGLRVSGDLDLNGTALTVRGPMLVGGRITGTGVIFVDGSLSISDGGSTVATTGQVAIAATGDVNLSASGPDGNYFKGLVYSEGDVSVNDITVVGTLVTNGQRGSEGNVKLDNVRFVRSPGGVDISVSAPISITKKGHSFAVSLTLTLAADGKSYICDARAYYSNDSDTKKHPNNPKAWEGFGDPLITKTWLGVDLGPFRPGMGSDLAREIGEWADVTEDKGGLNEVKWDREVGKQIPQILSDLLTKRKGKQQISFRLNNLLAEQVAGSRVLLWQPLEVKSP